MKPYFEQGGITIFCGDARDILPRLDCAAVDVVMADPPYGSTSLAWDVWPLAWPMAIASAVPDAAPLWCFGTFRMFWEHRDEFNGAGWKLAQDVIWEKHNGSGFTDGRFNRVHEQPVQFYRGPWADVFKAPQFTMDATARQVRSKRRPVHRGNIERTPYVSEDGGPRLMRSVLRVPSVHGDRDVFNETQKPIGIVEPLVRYSLRGGGMLLDPFCGAGTALVVAKQLGARAIGIDVREDQCEAAAKRLTQSLALFGSEAVG